jgi:hypothetical protein
VQEQCFFVAFIFFTEKAEGFHLAHQRAKYQGDVRILRVMRGAKIFLSRPPAAAKFECRKRHVNCAI